MGEPVEWRAGDRCWLWGKRGLQPGFVTSIVGDTVTVKSRRNSRTVYLTTVDKIGKRSLAKESARG